MAVELRHETLFDTDAAAAAANAAAEFRNDSSRNIHIREIDMELRYRTAANDESAWMEVSKSPVLASQTNNNVFFSMALSSGTSAGTTGSGADDVSGSRSKGRKFGKGQLTLEPGESLFLNWLKTAALTIDAQANLRYEFD